MRKPFGKATHRPPSLDGPSHASWRHFWGSKRYPPGMFGVPLVDNMLRLVGGYLFALFFLGPTLIPGYGSWFDVLYSWTGYTHTFLPLALVLLPPFLWPALRHRVVRWLGTTGLALGFVQAIIQWKLGYQA